MAPPSSAVRIAMASLLAAGLAVGATAGVAAGKTATIKGKLKGSSFSSARVVAVGKTTGVISTKAKKGSFTLKLPSSFAKGGATLHVIKANGTYAGPIVLRGKARKSSKKSENQAGGTGYVGLSGSVGALDLGGISMAGGAGIPSTPAPSGATTSTGVPLKGNGTPQGAGELGLVEKPTTSTDVTQGGDADKDGIVNAMDVDVNGNGVLNAQDTATTTALSNELHPFLFSSLFVPYSQATSANASAFDANVQQFLTVNFGASGSGATALPSVSVDCQGIAWCATATVKTSDYGYPKGTPWPKDAAGLYTVGHRLGQPDWDIGLLPNQPTSGIAVGGTFRYVLGAQTEALTMGPYFQAPPVLTQLGATPLGDNRPVSVTVGRTSAAFTVQRPQRAPVPGAETGTAISMGTLNYGVMVQQSGPSTPGRPAYCPASAFSGLSSTLAAATGTTAVAPPYGVTDSAPDGAPGPDRAISFTLDLTKCTSGSGTAPAAAPATSVLIDLFAQDAAGNQASTQGIPLTLQ